MRKEGGTELSSANLPGACNRQPSAGAKTSHVEPCSRNCIARRPPPATKRWPTKPQALADSPQNAALVLVANTILNLDAGHPEIVTMPFSVMNNIDRRANRFWNGCSSKPADTSCSAAPPASGRCGWPRRAAQGIRDKCGHHPLQFTPKPSGSSSCTWRAHPASWNLFDYKPELAKHDGKDCPQSFIEGKQFAFIQGTPKMLGPQAKFPAGRRAAATGFRISCPTSPASPTRPA